MVSTLTRGDEKINNMENGSVGVCGVWRVTGHALQKNLATRNTTRREHRDFLHTGTTDSLFVLTSELPAKFDRVRDSRDSPTAREILGALYFCSDITATAKSDE
jgi:hypothetical protein